jgi:CBS domain-containing protein
VPAVVDVVEFLRRHPPFDGLSAAELDDVAALTEIEFHSSGQTVLTQGAGPLDRVRVVRTGSIELICDGQVLDLLGEGEVFGQASMMSGLPAGFTARAAEDTLVYCLPTEAVRALLARPGALRFLVRSVMTDPIAGAGNRPPELDPLRRGVGSLLRMPLVCCGPDEPIRDVARAMTDRNVSAMLVVSASSLLGIITDTDLRSRVVAAGLDAAAPASSIMSAPVHTVPVDRLGGDVLLEMVELGVQHLPVLGSAGQVLGVLEDHDLVSAATRAPFVLRRAIDRAAHRDDVVQAAAGLGPTVIALRRGGADAVQISALWSVVVDAITRRLLQLAVRQSALANSLEPPPFTWLALGSLARREAVPSSDVDSALSWPSPTADPTVLLAIAAEVGAGLAACGLRADAHQVSAADPLFARPLDSWQRAAQSLLENPEQPKALLLTSVLVDHRAVWGAELPHAIAQAFVAAPSDANKQSRELLLRMLARYALVHKPPTGFLREFVLESGGGRRGLLDLKRGGLLPIVDLARWSGLRAGVVSASTPERLRAAQAAGTLHGGDAQTLIEAFTVISEVRMDHQVSQLAAGVPPDDLIRPGALSSIARAQLKETFRAVASVQRGVHSELQFGTV